MSWEAACREMILASAEDRDRAIALAGLLGQARWYVNDALEAHEHSDGRELLAKIDAALSPYSLPTAAPAGSSSSPASLHSLGTGAAEATGGGE